MITFRGLPLKKLFRSIPSDLLERYFRLAAKSTPEMRIALWTLASVQDFLSDSTNEEAGNLILQDLRRIHDVSGQSAATIVRAYHIHGLDLGEDASPAELAMRLFLDHPEAFDYAWSRYLFYGPKSKASVFHLKVTSVEVDDEALEKLRSGLAQWFRMLAKGPCKVSAFRDGQLVMILISRGSYVKTVARWDGDAINYASFRPASEDIIVYDPVESQVSIKATLRKGREKYLQTFLRCVADAELEGSVAPALSLEPLIDGTFDFSGNDVILGIDLIKVKLRFDDEDETEIELKSRNAVRSMRKLLRVIPATIVLAVFRFHIALPEEGRTTPVTFLVGPPDRTNLHQKKFADVIERYLVEQRVILRSLDTVRA